MWRVESEGGAALSAAAGPGVQVGRAVGLCCRGWPLCSPSCVGAGGRGGEGSQTHRTKVETDVGCKVTFLKAVWAPLRLRGPGGHPCQESPGATPFRSCLWVSGRLLEGS